ncbi:MAG: helix-turn-helix domain-containing protein [Planctomycetota bacterium]
MAGSAVTLDNDKVEALRKAQGWNRGDLSAQSGVSVETIGRIERGEACYPDTAKRIAAALDVRVRDLLPPSATGESAFDARGPQRAEGIVAAMDLRIWNGEGTPPGGFALADLGAVPLKEGDLARIEVAIDRSAYAYLLWIDVQGKAELIYPRMKQDRMKQDRDSCPDPSDQVPIEQIELPEDGSEAEGDAYSICGPEGMETIVLLLSARRPADFDFCSGLPEFPCQEGLPACTAVARFEYPSAKPTVRTRGVQKKTKRINDPVFQIQTALRKSLGPCFTKILAISFPNAGEPGCRSRFRKIN